MKRFFSLEWDAIAGIIAALAALVLHYLHIAEEGLLLAIALVLIALLLFRSLRAQLQAEDLASTTERALAALTKIESSLSLPDALLIGPRELRSSSEQFARSAHGDMLWFNVCLQMFRPQALFDSMLKPAIENPHVASILFVSDEGEKSLWEADVLPKVKACTGGNKVLDPRWCKLPESVSFILAQTGPSSQQEVLLSFWGEPFMARSTERNVPRYIFHIQPHSELIARLIELERAYRVS